MEIRLAGVIGDSIVDGPGLRLTIFTQGCPHRCTGCHNPETHDFDGGYSQDLNEFIGVVLNELNTNRLLAGITLTGGEPIAQADAVLKVAKAVAQQCKGRDIALFTGYTYEELLEMEKPEVHELLSLCSLLVDGKYDESLRDLTLKFRGSKNQRLIDPAASLKAGKTVEWKSRFDSV